MRTFLTSVIGHDDLERLSDLLLAAAASHVQEVGRRVSNLGNNVHRRHGEPGAVHHASNVAVQLDVLHALIVGVPLKRVLLGRVAQVS